MSFLLRKLQQPDVNKVFEFQHKLIELEELLENLDGHKFDVSSYMNQNIFVFEKC